MKLDNKLKGYLLLLFAVFFIAGCGDNEENSGNTEDSENDAMEENTEENEGEQQELYQIGETAATTSSSYGFPFEVTVNGVELTTDEVAGYTIDELYAEAFEPSEDDRFLLVNVTLTNTGDDGFTPNDTMSPSLIGETTDEMADQKLAPELDEEIPPGEELTADFVFLSNNHYDDGVLYLIYNHHDPNHEIQFEIPIPKEE